MSVENFRIRHPTYVHFWPTPVVQVDCATMTPADPKRTIRKAIELRHATPIELSTICLTWEKDSEEQRPAKRSFSGVVRPLVGHGSANPTPVHSRHGVASVLGLVQRKRV